MFNYRGTIEGREEGGAERDLGLKFRWRTVGKGFSEGRRRTRGEETKGRPAAGLLSDINSLFIAGINHSSPAANDPPGEYIGVIKGGTIPCRAVLLVTRSPSTRFFSVVPDVLLLPLS